MTPCAAAGAIYSESTGGNNGLCWLYKRGACDYPKNTTYNVNGKIVILGGEHL